ncbi:MAG TPA: MFS transporter [Terriglobales bacterium]|nr:MFS transporter [Terriglobales bacterium]
MPRLRSNSLPDGPTAVSSNQGVAWKFALRALRSRNYRLFFTGQSVSLIGTWMTQIATSWLVYRLTGSAWLLGIVGFASRLPAFVLGPFAGVWVDRWNRHHTLVVTQILSMLQSFALAGLALAGIITIREIIWLGVVQGVINAFDMPARQAFVIQMVEDRADLANAIALNSSMVNAARLLGPSIAGVIIAAVGEGYCFFIDGVSYLAVIASLLGMRIAPVQQRTAHKAILHELQEGWNYVTHFVPIRSTLLLLALVSLVGMQYTVLMPIFAREVLHGGAHTLGFLMGASGVGALAGAMFLATRINVLGLGRLIALAAAAFGTGLIALGLSGSLWFSLIVMLLVGGATMIQMAGSNTILQTIVPDDKRGRVMSFYSMAFLGMAPFGSLLAGGLAHRIGAPRTVMISGAICIAGAGWFASQLKVMRELVRPIYRTLGIIPEIAAGIQSASVLQSPPEE